MVTGMALDKNTYLILVYHLPMLVVILMNYLLNLCFKTLR